MSKVIKLADYKEKITGIEGSLKVIREYNKKERIERIRESLKRINELMNVVKEYTTDED